MRYLGIDYGTKRVGIALSDEEGKFALPYTVIPHEGMKSLTAQILEICQKENVSHIVIGESKNFDGKDNAIMKDARAFADVLRNSSVEISWEPEFMTSVEAERTEFRRADRTRGRAGDRGEKKTNDMLDASAAALILKHFLEKHGTN